MQLTYNRVIWLALVSTAIDFLVLLLELINIYKRLFIFLGLLLTIKLWCLGSKKSVKLFVHGMILFRFQTRPKYSTNCATVPWSYTSTSTCIFIVLCLIKHADYSAFTATCFLVANTRFLSVVVISGCILCYTYCRSNYQSVKGRQWLQLQFQVTPSVCVVVHIVYCLHNA